MPLLLSFNNRLPSNLFCFTLLCFIEEFSFTLLCFIEEFSLEQSCLIVSGVATVMYYVHGVDTTLLYVLLVRFALANLKISFCVALPETGVGFLQEDYHTY